MAFSEAKPRPSGESAQNFELRAGYESGASDGGLEMETPPCTGDIIWRNLCLNSPQLLVCRECDTSRIIRPLGHRTSARHARSELRSNGC